MQTDPVKIWKDSEQMMGLVKKQGISSYIGQLRDLHSAFHLADRTVRCIDEGTPGGIHLAGSGILADYKEAK